MTRGFVTAGLLVLSVGGGRTASAQQPIRLTVDEAVSMAIAQSPRVAEARAREASADASIEAREALGRPVVTGTAGYLRTNHVRPFGVPRADGGINIIFPDIPDNYRARAELVVPVYTGGRVDHLVGSAEAGRRAAEADTRATAADLSLGVVTAYWNLVLARERTLVLERSLERAEAMLVTTRARVSAGVLPPNDVLSAQAQHARQQVALIQVQNDAAVAEAELARLLGLAPGQPIEPVTSVETPAPAAAEAEALSHDALVTRAFQGRPERQALVDRELSLRLTADAAAVAGRPQVGVLAAVEPSRPNRRFVPPTEQWDTGWDLAVNMSWSVFDGGRARADRASATAEANAVKYRTEEFDATVRVDIRQRLLDLESGRSALRASEDAVAAAGEARRVVGERFLAGVATNTDVLDAEVAQLEAELERTRLLVAMRLNEARLLRTVGR